MPMVFINPGTEGRDGATLENARAIANAICSDLELAPTSIVRAPKYDMSGGSFGFVLSVAGRPLIELTIPGDDPATFMLGKPFTSRRMYVDGSSWLYGYAIGIIESRLSGET